MESEIKNLQSENNILHDLKINSLKMDITALEKIIQEVQAQLAIQRSSGLEACKVA